MDTQEELTEKLRRALEFYADLKTYFMAEPHPSGLHKTAIELDRFGDLARDAVVYLSAKDSKRE